MKVKQDDSQLKKWSIIGVFVIFGLAVLWHFAYDWLPNALTASLFPVNESPWEHVKLFFLPALIYFMIQRRVVGKYYPNFVFSHILMLPFMPLAMLLLHYLYQALGIESVVLDIITTFIIIALAVFIAYKLTLSKARLHGTVFRIAAFTIVIAMFIIYTALTFYPPKLPLFQDSQTLQYGIPR